MKGKNDRDGHFLAERFIGGSESKISSLAYASLRCSRDTLSALRSVEDLYAISVASFGEFEKKLLSIGVDYYHDRHLARENWRGYFDEIREDMNLSVLSLLTAGKALTDQLLKNANRLEVRTPNLIKLMQNSFSTQYDQHFEYRLISALRNTAQHSELPIGSYSLGASNLYQDGDLERKGPSRHRTTVDPKIVLKGLVENNRVNSRFRQELGAFKYKEVDLKFTIRGYMACLSRVMEEFRENTERVLLRSLCHLEKAQSRLALQVGKESIRHTGIFYREKGRVLEEAYLSADVFTDLHRKRKRWINLKFVQRGFISSETYARKDVWPERHDRILVEE